MRKEYSFLLAFLLIISFPCCAKKHRVKPEPEPVVEAEPVVEPVVISTPSAIVEEQVEEPSLRGKEYKESENITQKLQTKQTR